MKNLILASILSSVATAFAVPALTGPVHFAITRPYSMFGVLPYNQGLPSSVTLGTAPLDFILTDVMVGRRYCVDVAITVNGTPVFCCGAGDSGDYSMTTHLASGVFIPAGSVLGVTGNNQSSPPCMITLAGYVQ